MDHRTTLNKTLKPHWVWAIALGSTIGWGAFIQPIDWMKSAGPLGVVIGFTIGALLMAIIAISYGFLIQKFPVSGGEFAYTFIGLGRTHAFISGWFLILGYICIVALNATALSLMVKYIFPNFLEHFYLYTIAGWDIYGMEIIISTIALLIFGYMNIKGTCISGSMQFIFVLVMMIGVVTLTFLVGVQPEAGFENLKPSFPEDKTTFAAIFSIVAISPWAYVGFDIVPQMAEEFNFSTKKALMLIIFALLFATGIYSLMVITTAMAHPWGSLLAENHLWGTGYVIHTLIGPIGLIILSVALSMGIFTGLNGFILATSRLLFAMARTRIIPTSFGKLHPTYQTPHQAIICTVLISAIAPWFGREALVWIVDMSSIGVSVAYLYTCITAYRFFQWSDKQPRLLGVNEVSLIRKSVSALGILVSTCFIGLLLIPGSPAFLGVESRIALAIWVILGVLFYLVKHKEFNNISEDELKHLILGDTQESIQQNKPK